MEFIDFLPEAANTSVLEPFNIDRLNLYFQFLIAQNEAGGFFSAADSKRIADRHLYESMVYVVRIMSLPSVSRETHILDVGSGPGLPGYLFACLKNPPYVALLDSSRRRLALLQQFHMSSFGATDGGRVTFEYKRAEEFRGSFDVVTARALIPFPFNAILVRHLFRYRIALAAGPSPATEFALAILDEFGLQVAEESCRLPELDFLGERNLLLVRKKRSGASLPPVPWKKIKGEMDEWRKSLQ